MRMLLHFAIQAVVRMDSYVAEKSYESSMIFMRSRSDLSSERYRRCIVLLCDSHRGSIILLAE
jgi:hypothetical protein